MARTSENLVAVSVVAGVTTAIALFFWALDARMWAISLAVVLTVAAFGIVLYLNWKIWGMYGMFVPWWYTAPLALAIGWIAWGWVVLPNLVNVMNGEGGLLETLFRRPQNDFFADMRQDFWWNAQWPKVVVGLFFSSWTVAGFIEAQKRRHVRGAW
jgi:hypothetical protein